MTPTRVRPGRGLVHRVVGMVPRAAPQGHESLLEDAQSRP